MTVIQVLCRGDSIHNSLHWSSVFFFYNFFLLLLDIIMVMQENLNYVRILLWLFF